MPRCNGHNRDGSLCRRSAVNTSTKCRAHGGATPRGIASPHFKDGSRSKYLPMRLRESYHEALTDPELLNLRGDIALLDARLNDVLGRVDTGESGQRWLELREQKVALIAARRANNTNAVNAALNELFTLIDTGAPDIESWQEIQQLLEQRRKLVETERRRLVDMQQMITAEQATLLFTALLASVKRHVKDYDTLNAIQSEFILYTTANGRSGIDARSADTNIRADVDDG